MPPVVTALLIQSLIVIAGIFFPSVNSDEKAESNFKMYYHAKGNSYWARVCILFWHFLIKPYFTTVVRIRQQA